ncbi:CHAT domain-containing protein [Dapis sp. BLCC M172]|uniref:CHAT domain-containing protein n=1 Tax=Dapis sp. BLCC M172 TaxID=2975281 RepID=UPI003CF71C47
MVTGSKKGDGGNITINSQNGAVNSTSYLIFSSSSSNSGSLNISAFGDIKTESVDSFSASGNAGNVTMNSPTGSINMGFIDSQSYGNGNAGNISLTAEGDIYTGDLFTSTSGSGRGGNISLISRNGAINTTVNSTASVSELSPETDITSEEIATRVADGGVIPNLLSHSSEGIGGDISLTAKADITTYEINSFGDNTGGDVNITSPTGNINTDVIFSTGENALGGNISIQTQEQGNININHIATYSTNGTGGEVLLNSAGNVIINNIASFGPEKSGDVTIQSNNGTITTRNIQTIAENGISGNIGLNTYDFQGNINTADIQSIGDRSSGEVEVIAADGSITTQNLESLSNSGDSDDITVKAKDDVKTDEINSTGGENSGDIEVSSDDGDVNTDNIESRADSGDSGNIDIDAENDINTENISTRGNNNSGDIEVSSNNGEVNTDNIESRGDSGDSGNIDVDAETDINTENITTHGNNNSGDIEVKSNNGLVNSNDVVSEAKIGNSGDINIVAKDNIKTDNIRSFGGENSGNISVNSDQGYINGNNIETIAKTGDSGDIDVTAKYDINTDNISSIGGENSGNISVTSLEDSVNTKNIISQAETGRAGNIDISARNNINTGDITSTGLQGSGNINLTTKIGEISTGELLTDTGIININQPNNNIILPAPNNPFPITPPVGSSATNNTSASRIINQTPQIPTNFPSLPTNNLTLPSTPPINNPGQINNFFSTINNNQIPSRITSNLPTTNNNFIPNSEVAPTQTSNINNFPQSNININLPQSRLLQKKRSRRIISNNFIKPNNNIINRPPILRQSQILSRNSLTVDIARQEMISSLEKSRIDEYSNYFGVNLEPKLLSTKSARDILAEMQQKTGKKSAVIYVNVYNDKLQLILFTADGKSILKTIYEVNHAQLKEISIQFYVNIIDPKNRNSQSYLPLAQKLYNWLIYPMAAELEAANIDTLLLSMDSGFRLLPVAALHDGEKFLIEKYNISLIPSISLMNTHYNYLKNTQVLAMGASEFYDKPSLPAVPVELTSITQNLWQGNTFLNEEFTRKNLIGERQNYPYPIIHLATHTEFRSGDMSKSYIQLWDEKLQLDKIRELGWNNPEVELLVLSACRTAVGDQNAELGFAGLAIATGVKSALGSFWLVNDEATLGLMTEFYSYLGNVNIKAEALRKAQVAMLREEVVIEDGKLMGLGSLREVTLPPELASIKNKKFSHPYYWAGFTMVGSPW